MIQKLCDSQLPKMIDSENIQSLTKEDILLKNKQLTLMTLKKFVKMAEEVKDINYY